MLQAYCRSGNIRKALFFRKFLKILIMSAILIIEIKNLKILDFVKSPQITNSRKSKHAKITRSTVYVVNLPSAEYTRLPNNTRLPNTYMSRLPSAVCVCVCRVHKARKDTVYIYDSIKNIVAKF